MNDLPQLLKSDDLKLASPVAIAQHPAGVYLASLGAGSQVTVRQSLNAIAALLTNGECDALTLDWSKLRYAHTATIRSLLIKRYALATASKMLCALRRTLKEAWRLGLIGTEDYQRAVDLPRIDAPVKQLKGRALAREEIAAVLKNCQSQSKLIDIRDAAILAILRGSGIRRAELVKLELKDYHPDTGALSIISGKRGSDRTVYLPAKIIPIVDEWLLLRGQEPGPLVCPVNKASRVLLQPLSPDAILKIVKKRAAQAGVESFSPHDFRRTFCTDLLAADTDVFTVQKLAGHASPKTTAKYDRRGEETKRQAVQKLDI